MKGNVLIVLATTASFSLYSQNLLTNYNPPVYIQQQAANPVYASNQAMTNVQSTNASMRHQQRRSHAHIDPEENQLIQQVLNPPIQVNNSNIQDNNVGNEFNPQQQVLDNNDNVGNSFNTELLSINIPAIQLGNGKMDLNLDLKLPKLNFKPIKLGGNTSASKTSHRSHTFANKFHKINRKLQGKFSSDKKLHFKVDNCFKW